MGVPKEKSNVQKYTKKVGINLARREYDKKSIVIFIVGLVVIACVSAALGKFGVIDQYARLSRAEAEYAKVHEQNIALSEKLAAYSDVQLEYRTYSTDWMDDNIVYRKDILDIIEAELMPCGHVRKITINGNTAKITITNMFLTDVSDMVVSVRKQPLVVSTDLNWAKRNGEVDDDRFYLTIVFQPNPDEPEENQHPVDVEQEDDLSI